jgi:glyceraldehyde 3-phosphate dehydrogenase
MGRAACRIIHDRGLDIDVVAVNELGDSATMANLLARDSVHGRFHAHVTPVENGTVALSGIWREGSTRGPVPG